MIEAEIREKGDNRRAVSTPRKVPTKYTKKDVFEATIEYFKGDELAASVFLKYCLQDKEGNYLELTPRDMHKRLAKEFARIEKKFGGVRKLSEKDIFELLDGFKFVVPQGSPMAGIGNNHQNVSLSNCVVIDSPEDSITSIFDQARDMANLFKARCGVGIDISTLRPDGANVNNSAKTSTGAWSFADFYSYVTRMIGQSGRRGALMVTMDIKHPDIEKFITMKNDLSKVTGANISVKLTDEFMNAVGKDEEFTLQFPINSDNPSVSYTIKARQLWDTIIQSAAKTAEPGLIFWDTMLKELPAQEYKGDGFDHVSTNPCLTGDSWITTADGPKQIKNIVGRKVSVYNTERLYSTSDKGFWSNGKKDVVKVTTKEGFEIKATLDHKFKCSDGSFRKVKELKPGDRLLINDFGTPSYPEDKFQFDIGYIMGCLVGDGCVTYGSSARLSFWDKDSPDGILQETERIVLEHNIKTDPNNVWCVDSKRNKRSINSAVIKNIAADYGIYHKDKFANLELIESAPMPFQRGYIRGFFDTDGSVQGAQQKGVSIRLSQTNYYALQYIQRALLRFGIYSKIYKNRQLAGMRSLPDGNDGHKEYTCKANHELIISCESVKRYAEQIGFSSTRKSKKLEYLLSKYKRKLNISKFIVSIDSVEPAGTEEVFDCTVPEIASYESSGFISHNCSELILSGQDSCRLISLNLKSFVVNSFEESAYFDFTKFEQVVLSAIRLSDDLVELEAEKITNIINSSKDESNKILWKKMLKSCISGRRTGLGTHALADTLACLGLKYDSPEALEIIDDIYSTLKIVSYKESVELAKERGAFLVFNWEKEKNNAFIKRLPEQLKKEMEKHGRRNISLLTNAPTGSVSCLSQTSSGIEPVFRNFYIRRKKLNHDQQNEKVDFTDNLGDRWQEFEVAHHNIQEWLGKNSGDIPSFFVTSDQINWKNRIKLQGTIQRHIDHSISSTVNLPEGTDPSVVGELYMEAWKQGCKGVTVYVDGSRSGVLITDEDSSKKETFPQNSAPRRPPELLCDIHNLQVRGDKWTVLVGLLDGKPYEVLAGLQDLIEIPTSKEKGLLIKNPRKTTNSRYDLKIRNGSDILIKDVVKVFDNPTHGSLSRMISLSLRHGASIKYLVEQLQKDKESDMFSFSKCIARVLKKYIPENEEVSGESCGECQGTLIYSEGCVKCINCSWSRCN